MKIVVVGLGYVGLANAVLLAQHNAVIGIDTTQGRVDALNARQSPIIDDKISEYLANKELNLFASTDLQSSLTGADYVIVSTPTNFDEITRSFDTSTVEAVIKQVIECEPDAFVVVKSTIPVGFIDSIRERFNTDNISFSPEFLREGLALSDNLSPSRIVVGDRSERAHKFAKLLAKGATKKDINILLTGTREAEAIKLFSNTYLAMRVAFFNELDSYALEFKMNSKEIINGVSMDPRVGDHYNNPSFGYGGYCLPKDTKQLLSNFQSVPQNLIGSIVDSNKTRQKYLSDVIIRRQSEVVGIYRLIMKKNSDNGRQSSIEEVIKNLRTMGQRVIIFEPNLNLNQYLDCAICDDLNKFKKSSNLIITNRMDKELEDVASKVFTRDIFGKN